MPDSRLRVVYVTSNTFKKEESQAFAENAILSDGTHVSDVIRFDIRSIPIRETLEVELELMVRAEVAAAYAKVKVPCIVEHAGLIFEEYLVNSYPGGLTKPMWDALGDNFVGETRSGGRRALARASVAYCDGLSVKTFCGDRWGSIAPRSRGNRRFYWDTVFIPDVPEGHSAAKGKTYAEIVETPGLGLPYKMGELSQSSIAMKAFLEYYRKNYPSALWR